MGLFYNTIITKPYNTIPNFLKPLTVDFKGSLIAALKKIL